MSSASGSALRMACSASRSIVGSLSTAKISISFLSLFSLKEIPHDYGGQLASDFGLEASLQIRQG
jgi:hypothetical protein